MLGMVGHRLHRRMDIPDLPVVQLQEVIIRAPTQGVPYNLVVNHILLLNHGLLPIMEVLLFEINKMDQLLHRVMTHQIASLRRPDRNNNGEEILFRMILTITSISRMRIGNRVNLFEM